MGGVFANAPDSLDGVKDGEGLTKGFLQMFRVDGGEDNVTVCFRVGEELVAVADEGEAGDAAVMEFVVGLDDLSFLLSLLEVSNQY